MSTQVNIQVFFVIGFHLSSIYNVRRTMIGQLSDRNRVREQYPRVVYHVGRHVLTTLFD